MYVMRQVYFVSHALPANYKAGGKLTTGRCNLWCTVVLFLAGRKERPAVNTEESSRRLIVRWCSLRGWLIGSWSSATSGLSLKDGRSSSQSLNLSLAVQ